MDKPYPPTHARPCVIDDVPPLVPDEMPPRGGFIPAETLVLAGSRSVGGAIIAGGAILYLSFCRDETPTGPRFVRENGTAGGTLNQPELGFGTSRRMRRPLGTNPGQTEHTD